MPRGGTITIKTFKKDSFVVVTVKDTGTGIADDKKDKVFNPFFSTKGSQSSGLGLSVSAGIVKGHGGTMTVDSAEGQGTTFTITLPAAEGEIEGAQGKPGSGKQRLAKIMIIDDEEEMRNVLSEILQDDGHKIEVAANGKRGIELLKKKEFDLIFTDLGMPGMSGRQVAEEIKRINNTIPVALITGWGVQPEDFEMKKSGVDFIVKKPFRVDQVLQLVQEGMALRDKFKAV
jgi:CheY-like chemotaxis protein